MEKLSNILGQVVPQSQDRADAKSERVTPQTVSKSNAQPNAPLIAKRVWKDSFAPGAPKTDGKERAYIPRRRRPGMSTDLSKIKGILSKVLSQKGIDKKIERYEFILHWRSIVGEKLFEVSKPECIRNRALIVHVVHSVWAQELTFMKPMLLQKLSHYLKPGDVVTDMIFRVGPVE